MNVSVKFNFDHNSILTGIYLFKATVETPEKIVKSVQS